MAELKVNIKDLVPGHTLLIVDGPANGILWMLLSVRFNLVRKHKKSLEI